MLRKDGTCSTCTRKADNPYRHYNKQGNIIEGCIDKCHDPYLVPLSNNYNFVVTRRKAKKAFKTNNKNNKIYYP